MKGLFIPEITAEMFKNGCLESIESLMADGEIYDIDYPLEHEPKTGHWGRKTKVDAYDIAGVKTWGIKCQCDRCDFTTIVVEDFGYYKYCPNCGAKMEVRIRNDRK